MNPLERLNDLRVSLDVVTRGRQANIWTLLPAKIVSYDPVRNTCQVKPQILIQWNNPLTGSPQQIAMPVISDCPVEWPGGGGYHLTFPIQNGDECTIAFSSRCIDGWWSTGNLSPQGDLRMHDLSDGFVRPGVQSLPKATAAAARSTNTVQLRSDDGSAYVELASGHVVNIVTPTTVNINAPGGVNITGPVAVTGTVMATGEGTFNGVHTVSAHTHGGVQTGGSTTLPPTG